MFEITVKWILSGDEKSLRKASLGQHINSFQIINETWWLSTRSWQS